MLRDGSVGVEATWCGAEHEVGHDERCENLHHRLKRIVKTRGALDAQEAEALREADRLRLWRHYGYSSLLEYMEMEMGYTPRAAVERLRVAKAIVQLPAIAEAMAQGDLSFSAGRELTRVATPETEQQWLDATNDKNLRQIEDLVSGHKPGDAPDDPVDPKLRKRRLRYDEIDEETVALVREARHILERELGDRLDDDAFLRVLARTVVDGARTPERSHAPYQIAVTVCAQCKRGWQDGGGVTVEMSPDKLEVALCDAQHIGAVEALEPTGRTDDGGSACKVNRAADEAPSVSGPADSGVRRANNAVHRANSAGIHPNSAGIHPNSALSTATSAIVQAAARAQSGSSRQSLPQPQSPVRAKSDIPPALRRKVKARDHGRCRVPWCRSARNIDQHHIRPLSQGGQHTLENIISLCESHHLAHHAGALGITGTATTATFTRRAHNAFAIAEHVVDTKRALETLGFDKHEVKTAIEKTRTHVGTTELTLEQWIKIALSYCPKPRA